MLLKDINPKIIKIYIFNELKMNPNLLQQVKTGGELNPIKQVEGEPVKKSSRRIFNPIEFYARIPDKIDFLDYLNERHEIPFIFSINMVSNQLESYFYSCDFFWLLYNYNSVMYRDILKYIISRMPEDNLLYAFHIILKFNEFVVDNNVGSDFINEFVDRYSLLKDDDLAASEYRYRYEPATANYAQSLELAFSRKKKRRF